MRSSSDPGSTRVSLRERAATSTRCAASPGTSTSGWRSIRKGRSQRFSLRTASIPRRLPPPRARLRSSVRASPPGGCIIVAGMNNFELIESAQSYDPSADGEWLMSVYELADAAHQGQRRASGESYIEHPLAVAGILADLEMD